MHIADFLLRLAQEGGADMQCLVGSILKWVAFLIEQWRVLPSSSGDPLACAPVPHGVKRTRRLDPILVDAIGKAAGSRGVARSGAKVVALMKRFRRSGKLRMSGTTGNRALFRRAARPQIWQRFDEQERWVHCQRGYGRHADG